MERFEIRVNDVRYMVNISGSEILITDPILGKYIFSLVIPRQYSSMLLSRDIPEIEQFLVKHLDSMFEFAKSHGMDGYNHILSLENYADHVNDECVIDFFDKCITSIYSKTKSARSSFA